MPSPSTITNECYGILGPPDEAEGRGQPGGRQTDPNHHTEQHVYEDADKYTRLSLYYIAPFICIVLQCIASTFHVANAEYEAAMKHKKRVQFQNTLYVFAVCWSHS